MQVYTVHIRHSALDPDRDVVLVKEGFNWPAFFLSLFWALWKGLWLVAGGLLLLNAVLGGLVMLLGLDEVGETAVTLAGAVIVGYVANDLRRWTLARQGFVETGVIAAIDRDSAWQRLLDSRPALGTGALS